MTWTRAVAGLALAALTIVPVAGGRDDPPSARVLFIGNSLTYANDLPAMIEAVAAQVGLEKRVRCRAVARPDYSLEDHWKDGAAVRSIRDERWTHVVLQQGPSSLAESQASLRDYTKRFDAEVRRRRASVVLYGVWPPANRAQAFDAVTASYAQAARDVGGTLVPVGEGWRAAWRKDASLQFYGPDGFHPSPLGTYLAALMFFERITGRSPIGLPAPSTSRRAALGSIHLDARQLPLIQQAAAEARP
jgi:hypothetical protein